MTALTLDDVRAVLAAAGAAARELTGRHFAVCVVDAGGHVLGLERDPRAAVASAHSAESKARTAVYLLADTGALPPVSPLIPALTSGLPYPVNVFAGGLLVRRDGEVVGAVGVGGSPDPGDDTAVAAAGVAAVAGRG